MRVNTRYINSTRGTNLNQTQDKTESKEGRSIATVETKNEEKKAKVNKRHLCLHDLVFYFS